MRGIANVYDYIIVGAGLSGCTFAYLAKQAGKKCLVVDEKNIIGGTCATQTKSGIIQHLYGAHIFKTNNLSIYNFLDEISPITPFVNTPKAMNNGRLYSLPFNMNTFHELWGVTTPEEAKKIIESQRVACENPENLEQHALNIVGKDIYEIFIKEYTKKQWGKPCNQLPASIMRRIPLRYVFDNNYYNDKYQGIPECGYTGLMEQMLSGVETILGEKVDFNWLSKKKSTIIYTGAIDEFMEYKHGALEYRSLTFETKEERGNVQGVAVVNFTGSDVPYTRKIEHKNFSRKTQNTAETLITTETPAQWEQGNERYYPMEDKKNRELYWEYRKDLPGNVVPLGRLATYRYIDMAEAVAEALICADHIIK